MNATSIDRRRNPGAARQLLALLAGCWLLVFARAANGQALASWNDGTAKQAIVKFVTDVTAEGASTFVAPSDRIAVFDNDGTLWSEQPFYFQGMFVLDRIKTMAPQYPEWKEREPFKSILAGDVKTALAGGETALADMMVATHSGMTTEEFQTQVVDWLAVARHPRFQRPYTELVYQPMLELLGFLRDNGFKTFVVSGGGIEFMRPWTEKVYGIPPEQMIGSQGKLAFEIRDGQPVLVKLPQIDLINNEAGKPVAIQKHIGRRPIAAFGNSDGDLEMLQWTTAGPGPRFAMIVHHTDGEREWAYDRKSQIGTLEKAWDEAKAKGWTVVDMKRDWNKVFAFQ
jgi:hypothetical protein